MPASPSRSSGSVPPRAAQPHGDRETEGRDQRWMIRLLKARGRPVGALLLLVLTAVVLIPALPPVDALRHGGFDAYQSLLPRARVSEPVIIVEIDEASLGTYGQWPWPRSVLARLIRTIGAAGPAAVGVDILMPEPDRLSPERLSAHVATLDPELADRLQRLPSNDAILADAIRGVPVVIGVAGLDGLAPTAVVANLRSTAMRSFGGDPRPHMRRYVSALKSLDEIDEAAAGRGFIGLALDRGVVRRMHLAATVGAAVFPALGIEMLRVATGEPTLMVYRGRNGIRSIGIGDLRVPTEPDGSVWLYYGRHDANRFVSAADVLSDKVDRRVFEKRLVLVGVTALGLADEQATPVGQRMSGMEIHAQLLEGIFDGAVLSRPRWVVWLEAATLLVGGLVLLWAVPAFPVRVSAAVLIPVLGLPVALAFAFYLKLRVLYDAAVPVAALALLFTTMLGIVLADAESQRRALRRQLARQREEAARLAGELEAARRIQMGSLPNPATTFAGEKRITVYSLLESAREVGGDLYDFFPLDADRVFLLIGDVSGKGLPGSLFMAMSKSLFKSIALGGGRDIGAMMREANHQISRDNAEDMFVTVWAGVLDLETGALRYCSAGHDPPYVVTGGQRLDGAGGPPLCVLPDFDYGAAEHRMQPGETLCVVTDGVTEATSVADEFYGRERLEAVLARLPAGAGPEDVGAAIHLDVERFAAGVEPADDLAILSVRWNGSAGAPAPA